MPVVTRTLFGFIQETPHLENLAYFRGLAAFCRSIPLRSICRKHSFQMAFLPGLLILLFFCSRLLGLYALLCAQNMPGLGLHGAARPWRVYL